MIFNNLTQQTPNEGNGTHFLNDKYTCDGLMSGTLLQAVLCIHEFVDKAAPVNHCLATQTIQYKFWSFLNFG